MDWIIEEDKIFLQIINLTPEKVEELIEKGCWEASSYGRNLGLIDQISGFRFGGLDREGEIKYPGTGVLLYTGILVGVPLKKFKNQGSYDFWVDVIDEEFEDPTTYRADNIDSIELSFTQESGWNPIILYFPRDCVKRYLRNVRKITEKWCD